MEVLTGTARGVEVLVQDSSSTVYSLGLETAQGAVRSLRLDVAPSEPTLSEGDRLEVKLRQTAGGDDVVFCRILGSGAVVIEREKGEDPRRAWIFVGLGLILFVVAWYIVSNL